MKVLEIKHEDGTVWHVDAAVVARDRAEYYAEHDTGETSGDEYEDVLGTELKFALNHERELRDWAANQMLWPELKEHAVKVDEELPPRVMSTADLSVRDVDES